MSGGSSNPGTLDKELQLLQRRETEIKQQIQTREALRELRQTGTALGLLEDAPVAEFVHEYIDSKASAEEWLRRQSVKRPYWFDLRGAGGPVIDESLAASLAGGDPFALDTFSLEGQRTLLREAPELGRLLLERHGVDG